MLGKLSLLGKIPIELTHLSTEINVDEMPCPMIEKYFTPHSLSPYSNQFPIPSRKYKHHIHQQSVNNELLNTLKN